MAVSTIDALYNGGSEKVTATSTGIDVTGTVTAVGNLDILQLTGTSGNAFARFTDSDASSDFSIGADDNSGAGAGAFVFYDRNNTAYRLVISSSGNVGIGVVPSAWWSGMKAVETQASSGGVFASASVNGHFLTNAYYDGSNWKYKNNGAAEYYSQTGGIHQFLNVSSGSAGNNITWSESMRIDSSGNVLVGTTSVFVGSGITPKMTISKSGGSGLGINSIGSAEVGLGTRPSASHNYYAGYFLNSSGTGVGNISVTGSSTAYNTSSDYRLKTDAQPMTGASARVLALNPVNFEWIASGDRVDGFLAHEAATVVPESVTGTKDAMRDEEYEVTAAIEATYDDDGNELTAAVDAVMGTRNVPDYQGIDQSKLVPLLTAALQEALNKIDTMETRLAALEG